MSLVNQTSITIGDYAFAGTWENPLVGPPSITARVCRITTDDPPERLGDKADVQIPYDPSASLDPNGQVVSDGQGGTITISGLPVLTQGLFYLYFRKLVLQALEEQALRDLSL